MKPATSATLITCLRDEGPFLIEWLAYHRAIGFDRFIIGANDCTDGSHDMLTRLAEMGEVIYLPFPATPQAKGRNINSPICWPRQAISRMATGWHGWIWMNSCWSIAGMAACKG